MGLNINILWMLFKEDYKLYELNKEDIYEKIQILKSCIDEELFSSSKLEQNELLLDLEGFTYEYDNLVKPVGKIIIEVFGDRFKPIELLSRDDVDFISENREKIEELFNIFLFFIYSHHKLLNDFKNLYSKHRNFLTIEQKRGDAIAVYMHCLKTTNKKPTIEMLEYSSHMVISKASWEKKFKNQYFWFELKDKIDEYKWDLAANYNISKMPPEVEDKIFLLKQAFDEAEEKYEKLRAIDNEVKLQKQQLFKKNLENSADINGNNSMLNE